jgi:hypothetical protein
LTPINDGASLLSMTASWYARCLKFFAPIVIALAAAIISAAQPASIIGVALPVASISAGQTARISAFNMGTSGSPPEASCAVTMRFLDLQGAVLKEAAATIVVTKAASLDFAYPVPGAPSRVGLRAELLFGAVTGAPPGPDKHDQFDCSNIVPSLEIFDNATGRSSVILTTSRPILGSDPRTVAKSRR